jgi:hypothetical protein
MPITRKQFLYEIDTKTEEWMIRIHGFLAEHKDEAFMEEELRQHYAPTLIQLLSETEQKMVQRPDAGIDAFYFLPNESSALSLALVTLVEVKAVRKADIRGSVYYAYWKELKEVF